MTGYIIGSIVGTLIGILSTWLAFRMTRRPMGTLRVDQSDPDDEPYLFLELNSNVDAIKKRKYVIFDVNVENYISQK